MRGILRISFLIIIGILIGGFSAAVVFLTFFNRSASVQGVYGVYNINGVVPQGATITLLQKERGSDKGFVAFTEGAVPEDEGMWHFDQSKNGKSYEIQGLLLQNGKVAYQTSPIFVTAPMINQVLVFNLETPASTENATISGNIGINGYIPPGATLVLEAREFGTQEFTAVVKGIPARDNQVVSYTTATAGRIYEIQAILLNSAQKEIGTSTILQLAAPANNEELSINSTLQPPITPTPTPTSTPQPVAPQVTATATPNPTPTPTPASQIISGVIRFGGQSPTNSRIVIFQRVTGTQQFVLAIDNLTPEDGTTWQWTGATGGTSYDLIAILKQKNSNGTDTDISNSNVITVAAPAANEVFTINSGFLLSAPSGNITVSCNNYNSSNQTWSVGVSFQSVTNAQDYWYQIGVTNGGAELTNFTQNATNNTTQSFTEQFNNNVTYYARYASANVQNLQANDPQFSPFSQTTQLRCSQ